MLGYRALVQLMAKKKEEVSELVEELRAMDKAREKILANVAKRFPLLKPLLMKGERRSTLLNN